MNYHYAIINLFRQESTQPASPEGFNKIEREAHKRCSLEKKSQKTTFNSRWPITWN